MKCPERTGVASRIGSIKVRIVAAWKEYDVATLKALALTLADRLEEAERNLAGLRKMISCEEYDGTEANKCAEERPDPPDRLLHRCLTCQISTARRERDEQKAYADECVRRTDPILDRLEPLSAERDRLQAENERLREALQRIHGPGYEAHLRAYDLASDALRKTGGEKGGGRG